METVLKVENLKKKYKNFTAVNGISFEVKESEIVGLLGANGAGKTTTIHMILSLLMPTSGTVEIFGKNLFENREKCLEKMNFVAPYAALPYNLTVYENLVVFALLYGIKDYTDLIDLLIKEFKLEKFRKTRAGKLSSGEQTRLTMAKAFLNNPKLLLLDEPTSSLDPTTAWELRNLIWQKMESTGGATLWTSHNMNEMDKMCDRIIFLSHGKIVQMDTPQALKEKFKAEDLEDVFISISKGN
ncbi:MAG: ABC transporter ATP-binding protein [Candidatus Spechtbacteria bacterium RIFCSPHIGHO2_02_FULL_43_15b]|uniref:ABC transporter ATP-binding protein n=1 Tax=Candidatus Spechtbacteria bacterium RIFCSPHIGHO2_01_FULL_43_30 TaxID=1802158 RepID=A0A1G2H613_9BACT|nr:MAG: ABC transporter ATP-binding protein [Candidatus Spechtbacteria bacterium RIFCSPHIGHO2_01_FULL_43_30]OGZ60295.1 MAG: ABC transporter ATP-binding protein [Candidatus Spechtbacteria bacterium RIFCSPHIGHO2_02_FULL_43_15b]